MYIVYVDQMKIHVDQNTTADKTKIYIRKLGLNGMIKMAVRSGKFSITHPTTKTDQMYGEFDNWARSCENVSYAICEQQRCRSACASAQSDQHLCCSLPG